MRRIHVKSVAVAVCLGGVIAGCNKADKQLEHEMKVFALAYHQMAQGTSQVIVDEAGESRIEHKEGMGPAKLEDMAKAEPAFPELAKKIREGTFVVVWKAKLRPTADENNRFYL